jgi:hypothetical protein
MAPPPPLGRAPPATTGRPARSPSPTRPAFARPAFISGLIAHKTPFLVDDLGPDVEPFLLHLYAALAEKSGQ